MTILLYILLGFGFLVLVSSIKIVRPTHKMLIETLGKYSRTAEQGLNLVVPIIQKGIFVNITEQMVDIPEQVVQTSDKLNTTVDAMVYYRIKDVKASQYNVDDHRIQLTSLSRTTLRAVMGKLTLTECIQERDKINTAVEDILEKETNSYGVNVLRVEVQRIEPPQDVQVAMNEVVKAEQKKIAAEDIAVAKETEADGQRMADIKIAEGKRQASILEAQGKSEAFKLINEEFKQNAILEKQLSVTENSLKNNSKVILTDKGISPQLLIGDLPIKK